MNPATNRLRPLLICLAILAGFGLIYAGAIAVSRFGKVAVKVAVAPSSASLTINGQPHKAGTIYLKPGTYQFIATEAGFTTKVQPATVGPHQINQVGVPLLAQTDAAKLVAKAHASDYQKTEAIGSLQADAAGQAEEASGSITNYLPYTDPYYSIGYLSNADGTLRVTIHTESPRYRYIALKQIEGWGYDPTTLDIVFSDYTNPLESN